MSSYGLGRNFSAPTGADAFTYKATQDVARSDYGRSISQTDPLSQLRRSGRRGSEIVSRVGYNPSVFEDAGGDSRKVRIRRGGGGNHPPETFQPNSNQDAAMRAAQERAMQESNRRSDNEKREWWQRRRGPEEGSVPDKDLAQDRRMKAARKPHPSQGQSDFPRKDPKAYEVELRAHQEASKRIKEEEARKEREEEERLERRVQKQQDKMRREYEEEQERKRSKEQAVIQRQENLAHKQQEIRAEMERKKAEAEEEKAKTRRRKARLAAEAARRRSPGAYSDDERERGGGGADGRSDSPPIPTMRNRDSNAADGDDGSRDDVVNQLSTMRKELDKKQDEHDAVWNGLVEV